MNLPTPQYALLDYVCPFAVRVPHGLKLSGFSRQSGYPRYQQPPEGAAVLSGSDLRTDLPAPINSYTL